ncbi:MAG: GntR family transcriptional regulator [Acidiferrobacterales bacterium]|nr:GntR family transcriptional regulator [Acidiferrobacterales bacterium]
MSLVHEAYLKVHQQILDNKLPAGFQATEPELADRFNMSRTPLREALIRLENDGLVERIPRRGVRVLPLFYQDIKEIYQIFEIIEPEMAADLAKQSLDKSQIASLEEAIIGMEKAVSERNIASWAEYDRDYHRLLPRLQSNRRLEMYITRLSSQIHRARMVTVHLRTTHGWATEELRKIHDCIESGDAEQAKALFRNRWKVVSEELLGILKSLGIAQL